MGVGHFMRCLTLADLLAERGATVRFVSRAHEGNLIDAAGERNFRLSVLPAPSTAPMQGGSENYAEWLGVSQEMDAEQTIAAIRDERADWLIVDHYGLDSSWEQMLRPYAARLMVVEDLPERRHDCDLLLDQNESGRIAADYVGRAPEKCQLALGPRYALLRPDYARRRAALGQRNGNLARGLIFFGGSDPHDLTARSLEALSAAEFAHLQIEIVVGANYAHRAALERRSAARPGTHLSGPHPHLADLLATADFAIGAGGTTMWERMCIGVPSVVVCTAENQRPGCEQLATEGLIHYLGVDDRVDTVDIAAALRDCLRSPQRLVAMSALGQLKVDGLGAARIREALYPTRTEELRLRSARDSDLLLYFDWVSDPEVRRQSLNIEPISFDKHQKWFAAHLASPHSKLFVMVAGDLPVGQIRFDFKDGEALVDYSIDRFFRGHGWARRLVALGTRAVDERVLIRAEVKRGNLASCAVFERLGFSEAPTSADSEIRVFLTGRN